MSFSMNKIKSLIPTKTEHCIYKNKKQVETLEPVVGFKLVLEPSGTTVENGCTITVPELQVHLNSARHLPSKFGLKTVEGYLIKVKLFPGSVKYESSIQTSSWPRFNETFKFPLAPTHKSSFKMKKKDMNGNNQNQNQTLPEKLFKGTFVVLTVIALLELPAGSNSAIKSAYKSLKRQGSLLIRDRASLNILPTVKEKPEKSAQRLPTSESQRNIGSVTCFLDPKLFEENSYRKIYCTQEMWLPIKDITITPTKDNKSGLAFSTKGQVEIVLEFTEEVDYESKTEEALMENLNRMNNNHNTNPFEEDDPPVPVAQNTPSTSSLLRHRFSFSEVKRMIKINRREKTNKGLFLKISTSKLRLSIKVKEEFESVGSQIYLKTAVFENNSPVGYWKSENFSPSLSTKWENTQISVPLVNESSLNHISIKTTIATKTKMGKKIVLGTVMIGPDLEASREHWQSTVTAKYLPTSAWYNFE